ncbi:MAG TPA: GAF domain-containing protein [Patescibacteria group bacterium]|jgi:hypothetical protein|nr:GAF domain-containing protein [Patescibacteria group bacterium]
MKITQPIVIAFVVGIIVGGLVIGILDVYRPRPLFSSADSSLGQVCSNHGNLKVYWEDAGGTIHISCNDGYETTIQSRNARYDNFDLQN